MSPKKTNAKRKPDRAALQAQRLANLALGRGRPKGVPNKVTREIKSFATEVLNSPVYVASLWYRIKKRTLPAPVEVLFYYYAFGKPKERLEVSVEKSLAQLVAEAASLSAEDAAAQLKALPPPAPPEDVIDVPADEDPLP